MSNFTVEIPVTMTDTEITDAPFGSACNYWADIESIKTGYVAHVRDDEYGFEASHEVSYDDMREAFARIVRGTNVSGTTYQIGSLVQGYFYSSVMTGEDGHIDFGDIDEEAADVWMQIAVFDHIVYN